MTGGKLRSLRQAFGLELAWFASLLGTSAEKLARWEQAAHISLHPLQAQTLAILGAQQRVLGTHAPAFGRQILLGIMVYGPPYGLHLLLCKHFEGHAPEFILAARPPHNDPDPDV